jgi:predicted anti-sigma-YlaC factor YlaD
MNCKRIQELLKSDYLDGEANQREESFIKEHLAGCSECSRLEEELQAQSSLFRKAKPVAVPEHIWRNIRNTIVNERLKQETPAWLAWPSRSVFAFASAFAVMILILFFAGAIIQKRQAVIKDNGAVSFIDYGSNEESVNPLDDLGTNIEEYFL